MVGPQTRSMRSLHLIDGHHHSEWIMPARMRSKDLQLRNMLETHERPHPGLDQDGLKLRGRLHAKAESSCNSHQSQPQSSIGSLTQRTVVICLRSSFTGIQNKFINDYGLGGQPSMSLLLHWSHSRGHGLHRPKRRDVLWFGRERHAVIRKCPCTSINCLQLSLQKGSSDFRIGERSFMDGCLRAPHLPATAMIERFPGY